MAAAHGVDCCFEGCCISASLAQESLAAALVFGEGEQEVLNGKEVVAVTLLQAVGSIQEITKPFAEINRIRPVLKSRKCLQVLLDGGFQFRWRYSSFLKEAVGQAVLLQQGQQEMLRLQLLVALILCQLLSGDDGGPGLFRELFCCWLHHSLSLV